MLKTKAGEIIGTRVVISVPEAGEILEMSRDAAYRAAHKGDIPTIKIGTLLKVPVKRLMRMLEGGAA